MFLLFSGTYGTYWDILEHFVPYMFLSVPQNSCVPRYVPTCCSYVLEHVWNIFFQNISQHIKNTTWNIFVQNISRHVFFPCSLEHPVFFPCSLHVLFVFVCVLVSSIFAQDVPHVFRTFFGTCTEHNILSEHTGTFRLFGTYRNIKCLFLPFSGEVGPISVIS